MTRVLHSKSVKLGNRAGQNDGHGFSLVSSQARQAGAIVETKFDSTLISLMDDDRQASFCQRIDVPQDRARNHLQLRGELATGHASPILQEQQDAKKSRCAHAVIQT